MKETPRSFSLQPVMSLSGSDHRRSQRRPQSGIWKFVSVSCYDSLPAQAKDSGMNGVTYVSWSHDSANLLHRVEIRAQTTVHSENLLVDNGSNR